MDDRQTKILEVLAAQAPGYLAAPDASCFALDGLTGIDDDLAYLASTDAGGLVALSSVVEETVDADGNVLSSALVQSGWELTNAGRAAVGLAPVDGLEVGEQTVTVEAPVSPVAAAAANLKAAVEAVASAADFPTAQANLTTLAASLPVDSTDPATANLKAAVEAVASAADFAAAQANLQALITPSA
jgi:hypothetical protein